VLTEKSWGYVTATPHPESTSEHSLSS